MKVAAYNAVNARVKNFGGAGTRRYVVGRRRDGQHDARCGAGDQPDGPGGCDQPDDRQRYRTQGRERRHDRLRDPAGLPTSWATPTGQCYAERNGGRRSASRSTCAPPEASPVLSSNAQITSMRSGVGLTEASVLVLNGRLKLPQRARQRQPAHAATGTRRILGRCCGRLATQPRLCRCRSRTRDRRHRSCL